MKKYILLLFAFITSTLTYSQINVGTNFNIVSANPIDTRFVVNDTNAGTALLWKYNGLLVYSINDETVYSWNTYNG